ncbi:MAG: UDP-N-acetylmuramoyl-tripeptide--D-alanyl-D-alanine ligase [Pseudomonadota bacterium]
MTASLGFAATAMGGRLHGVDAEYTRVSIDTRALQAGDLFVALKGPNFDGADYLDAAREQGAAAAVVTERRDTALAQIVVDDTYAALGKLGSSWRDSQDLTVVGLTGSNGKTTLKELIGGILTRVGKTLATEGNLNNHIGVPLTLCRIRPQHRFAVIEMGANHAGEIAYLTSLVKPDAVALTNAGPAHLEGFGSIKGVSRAKGEILSGTPRPRTAVLNADDQYFDYWCGLASDIDVLSFGLGAAADVTARRVELHGDGSAFELVLPDATTDVRLALTGEHNIRNACAAAAVAHSLGAAAGDIAAGLAAVQPVGGRLAAVEGRNGLRVFDDSYNANPSSVVAAAGFLAALDGPRCFVLGDMGELGEEAASIHAQCGRDIRAAGVETLYALGDLTRHSVRGFGSGAVWFETLEELVVALGRDLEAGTAVLVKGSRFMAMERVVAELTGEDRRRGEAH